MNLLNIFLFSLIQKKKVLMTSLESRISFWYCATSSSYLFAQQKRFYFIYFISCSIRLFGYFSKNSSRGLNENPHTEEEE